MGVENELRIAFNAFMKAKEMEKAYECLKYLYKKGEEYEYAKAFRRELARDKRNGAYIELARKSYMLTGKDYFEDYMVAMEWDRPYAEKFYLPRRSGLYWIVREMQRLADLEITLLAVSAPPGIGKTGLGDFFMTFLAGKNPELAQLMGSHSKSILTDNYGECLRMLTSDEYNWTEIFTEHSVKKTNALDLKIDVDTPKKFSTLQFGSLGSGLAGKMRAMSLLYCDDLIPNVDVAMNKEQLDKVWTQYTTDLRQRKQGDQVRELHIATRWSVGDVIGRLERVNEGNDRAKFIRIPALNDRGQSNFDYGGTIGFTTQFYLDIQRDMDDTLWRALYMNEPIEREGLVYDINTLRFYYDLPGDEPDAVYAVCDTKDQGKDDCVMPIAYKYGNDYYFEDILCDNSLPEITTPRIVDKLITHKVKLARFESNSAGGRIAKDVSDGVKSRGGITSISTKYSTRAKETRIIVDSAWVKSNCLFKDKSRWDSEYRKAMNKLTGYAMAGKNKHDDVPDAMSMFADFMQSFETNVLTVRQRVF